MPATDTGVRETLARAVGAVDAPDVVVAWSRRGERAVCTGGTAPAPPVSREVLRYEIGSAGKTLTGLLLAAMVHAGRVRWSTPAHALLTPGGAPRPNPITLLHLVTHTSGLPTLPVDLYPGALRHRTTNPYAGYSTGRVLEAFARHRSRRPPGSRWRYSNLGAAVLGHALGAACDTSWEGALEQRILVPLRRVGVVNVGTAPAPGTDPSRGPVDAVGHGRDGVTPVPPLLMGGFPAAGAVRGDPVSLLRLLELHLRPAGAPDPVTAAALETVRTPVLRRGRRGERTHTVTWFREEGPRGPVLFHAGATCGQQAFLGFRPGTGTALVVVCTRRFRLNDTFPAAARGLLDALP
ncbi:serine hydrolase domain-containing protein [Streptomyces alkaliphilus]|uniref:serine hydrolase domain-containing protein n=1 Tax=Streptomyces alkaliphilus TaxID=1472722 RepID=UPI0034D1FBE2